MAEEKALTKVQELIYEMNVAQVMTTDVVTVSPTALMSDLQELLRDHRISGVPVVDKGELVGLVSIEDFIKCLVAGKMEHPVSEWMSREVKTLHDSHPLIRAVEEFSRWGYGRFPVVNRESGRMVGIITKGDIFKGLLRRMERNHHKKEKLSCLTDHSLEEVLSDNATITFQYNVIGKDFKRAGEASSKLKKKLTWLGVTPRIIRRIAIATFEAEMNVVVFTDGGQLTVRITPGKIAVEAEDSGPGIPDIEKAMEPGYSTAPDWVRELGFGAGMGLPNIKKCADDMRLDSTVGKGTRLEFSVYLNHER